MKKLLFLLVAVALLSGCSQTKFISWEARRVEHEDKESESLRLNSALMDNAIKSRDYLLLYEAISNKGIPAAVLSMINKSDRIGIISADRDSMQYVDFLHLFIHGLNRNLVNAGYRVVFLGRDWKDYLSNYEELKLTVDKLLVFSIWEAGCQNIISSNTVRLYSGFQMNLDLVDIKNDLILFSTPVFGSASKDLSNSEFEDYQLVSLRKVNADLPLLSLGDSSKSDISLEDNAGYEFILKVYNPNREDLSVRVYDLTGNLLMVKDLQSDPDSFETYTYFTWDGKYLNGNNIQAGEYMLDISNALGSIIAKRKFTFRKLDLP